MTTISKHSKIATKNVIKHLINSIVNLIKKWDHVMHIYQAIFIIFKRKNVKCLFTVDVKVAI
jgi:hypothetical protein